jgi:hypothetical protein
MQSVWWKNWGLRLDPESLYVARRYGWFESGWSQKFIRECFRRNGYDLLFFSGGYLGSELGLATRDPNRLNEIRSKAVKMGLSELHVGEEIPPSSYATAIGISDVLHGRPALRQIEAGGGRLMYGPYVDLPAGSYELAMMLHFAPGARSMAQRHSTIVLDIAADFGRQIVFREELSAASVGEDLLYVRRIDFPETLEKAEIRAEVSGGPWTISIPSVRRLS